MLKLVNLGQLLLRIGVYELLDDHVATTDTDDKLAIENLRVDLPGTEYVVAIAEFLDRNWTVCLVDVLTNHLVKQVTLRHGFRWGRFWLLCGIQHCSEALLKLLDDAFLVAQEPFHLRDLLVTFGNQCLQLRYAVLKYFLFFLELGALLLVSVDCPPQVLDLIVQLLELPAKVLLLLCQAIELRQLRCDPVGTVLKCVIYRPQLTLYVPLVCLGLGNQGVQILNLRLVAREQVLLGDGLHVLSDEVFTLPMKVCLLSGFHLYIVEKLLKASLLVSNIS